MTQFSSLYGSYLDEELHSADSTILFTTARRKAGINKGLAEFADLTECFTKQSTLVWVGGTAETDLNSTITAGDFVRLSKEQVQFRYTDASSNETVLVGDDDLPRREVEWLNRYEPGWQVSTVASSAEQFPSAYYERMENHQRLLGFWPVPSTGSSCSIKVLVPYIARPTPLTSDTQEPFATASGYRTDLRPYHQAAVHYAAFQLEKLRPDLEASRGQLAIFMTYVARFVQNSRVKGGTFINPARRYFQTRANRPPVDPRV